MSIVDKFVNACWGPKVTMPKKEEEEFEKAFTSVAKQMAQTRDEIAYGVLAGRSGTQFNPGPHRAHVRCARKVLMKLIEQADSIIADPEDLAKRAWAIADEMEKQEKERCK